ncbi:MAG: hypothetical protein U9P38_06760, partial [Campylobacterota bacterium]|nr:hypothetical protein [Campylobacterota bacterium]
TYFYKDTANTIMLMPTNALVRANGGLIAPNSSLEGDRTKWSELHTDRCDYMTYDKFAGHLQYEDISNINIIIDEAHNLLSSDKELYQMLIMKLLKRQKEYRELKLITATLRLEILEFYKDVVFDTIYYIKEGFKPHINFVYQFPKIDPTKRTLIFLNSLDKIYVIQKYLRERYSTIDPLIINSKKGTATKEEIDKHQLILATSFIKEGYSIESKIDTVIICNRFNSVGVQGILQYMARPRNQTPVTYVVMASTHFKSKNFPKHKDNLDLTDKMIEFSKSQGLPADWNIHYRDVATLYIKEIQRFKESIDKFDNISLTSYIYEHTLKSMELYYDDGLFMKGSLLQFIPDVMIEVIEKLEEMEPIEFPRLDLEEYEYILQKCRSVEEVRKKIGELINEIKLSLDEEIREDKNRVIEALEKIAKVVPYKRFIMDGNVYNYTDEIIVRQMIKKKIFERCKWHQTNLEQETYQSRGSGHSSLRLNIGDEQTISKVRNKFKRLLKKLKLSTSVPKEKQKEEFNVKEGMKILNRLYSYEKEKYATFVIITALYPVLENWYSFYKKESELNLFDSYDKER